MSLITSKIRKARKEYVCSFCGEEVSKLRNLVKRLLPYAEQRLAELHTPITPYLVEARQALEEEDGQ